MSDDTSQWVGLAIFVTAQAGLLAVRYGWQKTMPWWVTWFPSLVIGGILGLIICFMTLIFIVLLVWGAFLLCKTAYDWIRYRKNKGYY